MSTLETVAKGAALLDEVRPGWYNSVNVENLDIRSLHGCVLGQVYGEFSEGLRELWGLCPEDSAPKEQGFDLFCGHPNALVDGSVDCEVCNPEYAVLTAAWRDLITERQAEDRCLAAAARIIERASELVAA